MVGWDQYIKELVEFPTGIWVATYGPWGLLWGRLVCTKHPYHAWALRLSKGPAVDPCVPIRGWRAFAVLLEWDFPFYGLKKKSVLYVSKQHCKPNIDTKRQGQGIYIKAALVIWIKMLMCSLFPPFLFHLFFCFPSHFTLPLSSSQQGTYHDWLTFPKEKNYLLSSWAANMEHCIMLNNYHQYL